ncbi:hypothetical protein MNR01_00700 [Lysobacter sp. S4-A87]|uniref:hypothetical protein n=1 Tax=Lysobacter sp. S4-A87 TaxID=2925843 RepID=UPI001F531E38|nr:hypothetical protein [Lysobacter sp. S4-A87]UNK49600.1 hypothetical protein MNR01_00700 [Lysobacter sp. S4-A87]
MTVHHLTLGHVSDDALMTRMFDLVQSGKEGSIESSQIDAEIYARLLETYGADDAAMSDRHAA